MAHSHLALMLLYAALVALVGGTLLQDRWRDQVRAGGVIFGSLAGAALVAGWVLRLFPF